MRIRKRDQTPRDAGQLRLDGCASPIGVRLELNSAQKMSNSILLPCALVCARHPLILAMLSPFHPFRRARRTNWMETPFATVRQAWQGVQWRAE
jgi:hypothetical protein